MNAFHEFAILYQRKRRQDGGFAAICAYLQEWPDLDAQDNRGRTLYHHAVDERDVELAQFLHEHGCPYRVDAYGEHPLYRLANLSTSELARLSAQETAIRQLISVLVAAGANLKRKNKAGKTLAFYAVNSANWVMVSCLIEHGAKFDEIAAEDKTLLHILAVRMDLQKHNAAFVEAGKKTLAMLMEHQLIDVSAPDMFGTTAQTYLQRAGLVDAAAILGGDAQDATGGMRLDQAVVYRNLAVVNAALEQGADANLVSDEFPGRTVLMLACQYPNADIVAALLAAGADANFHSGENGRSCVYYLLGSGFDNLGNKRPDQIPPAIGQILRHLQKYGLRAADAVDDRGNTALHHIVSKRTRETPHLMSNAEQEMLDCFLQMKADPDAVNLDGVSALMLYAGEGDETRYDIAQTLLDAGAQVYLRDSSGRTALHYAAMNDKPASGHKIARLLLEQDPTVAGVVDNEGKTALDVAAQNNREMLVKLLLEYV